MKKSSKSSKISPNSSEKTSALFCDPNADVTFISSDGIIFKIHSKYFLAVSAGFAAPESTVIDKPAVLSESARVLEVLFQFVHPTFQCEHFHQPSIIEMDVKILFEVATAAEKYVVYAAMNMCATRMHYELYLSNPIEVLNHAANHGYSDLADKAAIRTMSLPDPLKQTLMGLTDPRVAVKWTKYYGHWVRMPTVAKELQMSSSCPRYNEILTGILCSLAINPTKAKIDIGTPKASCLCSYPASCPCVRVSENCTRLLNKKVEAIPKFSKIS